MPRGYHKDGTPNRPPNAGVGRKKGAENNQTRDVKAMVIAALTAKGGKEWLMKQMNEYPAAFMGLIGRLIPMQTDLNVDGTLGTYDVSDKPLSPEEWAAQAPDHMAAADRASKDSH